MKSAPVATPKKPGARSRKGGPRRPLMRRGLLPTPGADNLLVVKAGEDLRAGLEERLGAMKADFEKVEFFWSKTLSMPEFSQTREYTELAQMIGRWEMIEGVRDILQFKAKMKRLKTLLDLFQPGCDYELTVREVVEIQT